MGVMAASHAYPCAARPVSQPGWPSAAARAASLARAACPAGAACLTGPPWPVVGGVAALAWPVVGWPVVGWPVVGWPVVGWAAGPA